MESNEIVINKLNLIQRELDLIKKMIINKDPEGELSDWAKNQLKLARESPASDYIPHQEVKKRILSKK